MTIKIYSIFNQALDTKNISLLNTLWNKHKDLFTDCSGYILVIRYHLINHDIRSAIDCFNQIEDKIRFKRKRLFTLIVDYLVSVNDIHTLNDFVEKYIYKYDIDATDIETLLPFTCICNILEKSVGKPIIIKDIIGYKNESPCGKFKISDNLYYRLMDKIKNTLKGKKKQYFQDYLLWLDKQDYDCVIDGGNVLYSVNGRVNFERLKEMIDSLSDRKVLLVVHEKYKINNNCLFYATPYGINDDLFILAAGLRNKQVVSNDKFRDHLYSFGEIDLWLKEYVITFDNINLYYPPIVTKMIQKEKGSFYIPMVTGWIKI